MNNFQKPIYFMSSLLILLLFSNCKKDLPSKNNSVEEFALQGPQSVNAVISYSAQEISYSEYKYPVSTDPSQSGKYLNTFPRTQYYDLNLNVNSSNVLLEIDNMRYDSPVDSWNKNSNRIAKLVNNGTDLIYYDKSGNEFLRQDANLSSPKPTEIYQSFLDISDNRPIIEVMQEFVSKGATVKESTTLFAVKTTIDNPNFNKNSVSVYSKSNSRLVSYTEFEEMNIDRIKNNRFIHYDISGYPTGIHTESFNYLQDGDIEKAISIIKLSNVIISLN